MTGEYVTTQGAGPHHLWTAAEDGPWPSGTTKSSGEEAACGYHRSGDFLVRVRQEYRSLKTFATHGDTCEECAYALAERHGATDEWGVTTPGLGELFG